MVSFGSRFGAFGQRGVGVGEEVQDSVRHHGEWCLGGNGSDLGKDRWGRSSPTSTSPGR